MESRRASKLELSVHSLKVDLIETLLLLREGGLLALPTGPAFTPRSEDAHSYSSKRRGLFRIRTTCEWLPFSRWNESVLMASLLK